MEAFAMSDLVSGDPQRDAQSKRPAGSGVSLIGGFFRR